MAGVVAKFISFFDRSRGVSDDGHDKNLATEGQPDQKLFEDLLTTTFLKKYDSTTFQDTATHDDLLERTPNKVVTPENQPVITGDAVTTLPPDVDHPYYRYSIAGGGSSTIPVYSLTQQSSGSSTYDVTIAGVTNRTQLPDQYFIILDAVSAFPLGYTIAMNVNGSFYEDIYKGFNPEKFQEAPQAGFKYLVTKLGSDSYLTIAPNYSDALFDANGGVLPINKLESNSSSTPLVLTSVNGINSFQPPQVLGELLYYFTSTVSDVASSYKQTTEPQVAGTTLSFAGLVHNQLITKFYSEPNNPNRLSIPAGTYQSHLHAYKSAGTKNLAFRVEVWEVNSVGVDIAKIVDIGASSILGGSLSEQLTATSVSTEYSLTSRTSRICHKYYAVVTSGGSAPTMVIAFGGGNDSHSNLPAPIVDSSNYVPYTGMSSDLNTGTKDIVYENATANTPAWFDSSKKFITGTHESFGDWFNSASNKTLPVDGDKITYLDSTTSFGIVKTTLLNLWDNYIKTKTDAIYLKLTGDTLTGALNKAPSVTLASASTVNIGGANSDNIVISGNASILGFDNVAEGILKFVRFTGTPLIQHSNSLIILPNSTNIQAQAGDTAIFRSLGSGVWTCFMYQSRTSFSGSNVLVGYDGTKLVTSNVYYSYSGNDLAVIGTGSNAYVASFFDNSKYLMRMATGGAISTVVNEFSFNTYTGSSAYPIKISPNGTNFNNSSFFIPTDATFNQNPISCYHNFSSTYFFVVNSSGQIRSIAIDSTSTTILQSWFKKDGTQVGSLTNGGLLIGTGTISSDSIFDAKSTTKGSRPYPEYTYTAMNALTSINDGAFVSVISSGANNGLYRYNGTTTTWQLLPAGGGGSGITRSINATGGVTITAGATVLTDYIYTLTGANTITLPTAIGNTNTYTFKYKSGTTTLNTTLSQTIDGGTSIVFSTTDQSITVYSDGANWNII